MGRCSYEITFWTVEIVQVFMVHPVESWASLVALIVASRRGSHTKLMHIPRGSARSEEDQQGNTLRWNHEICPTILNNDSDFDGHNT